MSDAVATTDLLWTLDDLERRWQPRGPTAKARRKWIWRRVQAWDVPHDGNRRDPRFLPGAVLRAEQRHLGGRFS